MQRPLRERLDTPVACLLTLLLALSLFTVGQFALRHGDPSAFIVAGDRYSDPAAVPANVTVLRGSEGYDGQFYYRLALDPFTSTETEYGITLDNAPYRHQRILYPLIVHAVTLGDARFVPVAMIATNFAFFCLLAWLSAMLAQSLGRHALWGLLIVAQPGLLISYSRDLVEIVEAAFLIGSVLLVRRGRVGWATVLLTLAVMTRETSLLVAVAAAGAWSWDRVRDRRACPFGWSYFAVPGVAFGALQSALYLDWGRFPVRAGRRVLGDVPFTGFLDSLSGPAALGSSGRFAQCVALGFVIVASLSIVRGWASTRALPHERLACLLYGVLLASVGGSVWIEDVAYLRVFTQFYLFGAIVVLAARRSGAAAALAVAAATTWTFEFYHLGSASALVRLLRTAGGA